MELILRHNEHINNKLRTVFSRIYSTNNDFRMTKRIMKINNNVSVNSSYQIFGFALHWKHCLPVQAARHLLC